MHQLVGHGVFLRKVDTDHLYAFYKFTLSTLCYVYNMYNVHIYTFYATNAFLFSSTIALLALLLTDDSNDNVTDRSSDKVQV